MYLSEILNKHMACESGRNCVVPPAEKAKKNSDNSVFYCIPCKKNVFCNHQGFSDAQRYMKCTIHVNMFA